MTTTETPMANTALRLHQLRDDARCLNCGTTQAECARMLAADSDPIGCCHPHDHRISPAELSRITRELESGTVAPPRPSDERPKRLAWWFLLSQGIIWQDKNGGRLAIAKMAPEHRYNCLKLLERNAAGLGDQFVWSMLTGPQPSGDAACDAFDCEMDRLDRQIRQDPVGWVRSTNLWQALNRGLPSRANKRWRLAQRARHWGYCQRRQHNSGPCNCNPPR